MRGTPKEFRYGDRARFFCADCGTPLRFQDDSRNDEIELTVCSLDEPERIAPTFHIWTEDQLPWIMLADRLPRHERSRE